MAKRNRKVTQESEATAETPTAFVKLPEVKVTRFPEQEPVKVAQLYELSIPAHLNLEGAFSLACHEQSRGKAAGQAVTFQFGGRWYSIHPAD